MNVSIARGDIAAEPADALVNAAETSLRMGSGVAGTLMRAADGPIERDAREQGPIGLGEVVVTDAYDLDASYVIHAAVVSHGGVPERATERSIRRATRNALATADDLGCRSVVLPLLGCGNGGFYVGEGAKIVLRTVRDSDPTTLEDVRAIGYTRHESAVLESVAPDVGV